MKLSVPKAFVTTALAAVMVFSAVPAQAGMFDFLGLGKKKQDDALSPDLGRSDDQQVAALYNGALDQMTKGNYNNAAKKFAEVERLHPYSKWATKAILMQGFSFYQSNKYADAIDACQRFITLHPGHENIDYAYYMVALSQYEQINDITRDQKPTQEALDALEEVQRRFPQSRYAADAGQKALLARDHLAGKEMEIGRYYFKKGDWMAGINRFKTVITGYQQTSQAPEALYRLTEGYMALGIRSEAQTAAAVLGHNFPRSSWYKDAYQLVSTDGQAPVGNNTSWIWKAFGL
nr:outer membrane protein assembly factor BamD [Aestuariivirga litoralis]